jgi:hypothetical protein
MSLPCACTQHQIADVYVLPGLLWFWPPTYIGLDYCEVGSTRRRAVRVRLSPEGAIRYEDALALPLCLLEAMAEVLQHALRRPLVPPSRPCRGRPGWAQGNGEGEDYARNGID